MRVAFCRLYQEVHGFSPKKTTIEDFKAMGVYSGSEIISKFENTKTELSGFIHAARLDGDVKLIPTFYAESLPCGPCTADTHQFLKTKILDSLQCAGKIDGMLISLHGAMSAEDEPDVEGDLLAEIRKRFDPDIPIGISLNFRYRIG